MTCLGLFICNLLEGGVGHGRCSELFLRSLELFLKCLELYVNSLERLIKCSQPCFVSMQKKHAVYFLLNAGVWPLSQDNCPAYTKILFLFLNSVGKYVGMPFLGATGVGW